MNPSQIVLFVGIGIVLLGAYVWATRKNQSSTANTIKRPGGFEFTLTTPALAMMAMGVVLILVSSLLSGGVAGPSAASGVDPELVGDWDGPARYQNIDFKLHFEFRKSGSFFRRYIHDEQGQAEAQDGAMRFKGSQLLLTKVDFALDGDQALTLTNDGRTLRFARDGVAPDAAHPIVGVWATDLLVMGATYRLVLTFDTPQTFRLHGEATDEGPFSASNGDWTMKSNWDTRPIQGSYKLETPVSLSFEVFPFGRLNLQKALR